MIWDAGVDSDTLPVAALSVDPGHADRFDPNRFAHLLAVVADPDGREHAVFSDGYRRIRIDVEEGSLMAGHSVLLRYALAGPVGRDTEMQLAPLRRLAGLLRTGRFLPALFPAERRVDRLITVLRVGDALHDGASQRDIAAGLFGTGRISSDWRTVSDSLRSRVRRLIREARRMAAGGYRGLPGGDPGAEG